MTNPPKKTMVCVTVQKTCERLIRQGAALAGSEGLRVVHVAKSGAPLLGAESDGEALEYLFRISREYGAQMDVLRSDDVIETLVDFIRRNAIECVVLGAGKDKGTGARDISGTLWRLIPEVSVHVIS